MKWMSGREMLVLGGVVFAAVFAVLELTQEAGLTGGFLAGVVAGVVDIVVVSLLSRRKPRGGAPETS